MSLASRPPLPARGHRPAVRESRPGEAVWPGAGWGGWCEWAPEAELSRPGAALGWIWPQGVWRPREAFSAVESEAVLSARASRRGPTETGHAVWLASFLFEARTKSSCLKRSVSEASQGMPTEQGPHRRVKPCPSQETAQTGRLSAQSSVPLLSSLYVCDGDRSLHCCLLPRAGATMDSDF